MVDGGQVYSDCLNYIFESLSASSSNESSLLAITRVATPLPMRLVMARASLINLSIPSSKVTRFGNGPYNSHITGLTPNTLYYLRAYATNSSGTSYGNQISFVTDSVTTPARVLDAEGNSYPTVSIGSQLWMQTNLRTRKDQNGDTLRFANTEFVWYNPDSLSLGGFTFFQHQLNPVDTNYGGFYNWYAINDPRNLCPACWHVPDEEDWEVLSSFLNSNAIAVNDPAVFKATHAKIYQGNGTPTGEFGGYWNY
jgi:uncharacterized protein (TIGR02145 family)